MTSPSLPPSRSQLEDELHAERQRANSAAHKASDEAKRLAAQCLELQRELEAQGREVTRLKVGGGWRVVRATQLGVAQAAAVAPTNGQIGGPTNRTAANVTLCLLAAGGAQGCTQR